jgi:hypothetical protein
LLLNKEENVTKKILKNNILTYIPDDMNDMKIKKPKKSSKKIQKNIEISDDDIFENANMKKNKKNKSLEEILLKTKSDVYNMGIIFEKIFLGIKMYIEKSIFICTYVYICMYMFTNSHIYLLHIHIYICIYIRKSHMSHDIVCICICICKYTCICIYEYTYMYICIHIDACIYIYIHIFVHIGTKMGENLFILMKIKIKK